MTPKHFAQRTLITGTILAFLATGGTYAVQVSKAARGEALASAAIPAAPVTVHTLVEQKVRIWSDFSGRLEAVDAAEIRPEVGGRITEALFEDGQTVKAGDVLFVIDPRPYEAAVARARANLASARSNDAYAKAELGRGTALVRTQALAQSVYDQRANASRVAAAEIDAAAAQ